MAKMSAKELADKMDDWAKSHAIQLQPECTVCSGVKHAYIVELVQIGDHSYIRRVCDTCGHTLFIDNASIGLE